ncbi:unnamed protein product, partial [Mesorhabditis spiculigera]
MFDEPSAPANKSITTPNHQQQHHHTYSTSYSTASWCRIPSTLSILLCFLFLLSLVQAACAQTEDQGCGEHPLKGILQKLEISRPNLTFEQTTRLLQQMRTTILYFFALISMSLSIQCFLDRNNHTFRHTSDKTTVDCSGNYCMKMVVEYDGAQETDWDCGDNICPEQAGSHQYHGRPEHTYCCQGAKCNTATAFQLIRIIFGISAFVMYRLL